MGKVITVNVHCVDSVTFVTDAHFFHKDFGSQLVINGLNLETGTQVHFSLTEKKGKPISMIGVSDNGIFTVDVPDNVLNSNSKRDDYEIYAFVYCTEENSGWTEHEIVIPVKMRPDKEFEQPISDELTAFDKVAQYVSETVESIAGDREQINKNKEDIEYLKEHGADNVKIEVDKELSTKSENPIANKAVAKEFEKYGDTVEITEDIKSSKEKSVMIINPNAEEVLLYTAEEVDAIVEELLKNGVSEEDIANAVKKYLDENPIEVDVPKNLSELNDDAEHRTVTDKEKESWNGKLDESKLPEAVNTALEQAKASGEFDGADGKDGQNGKDGLDGQDGEDGADGITPHIGENGNWFIGDEDTGVSATGQSSDGTKDYGDLENKPSINGVTLSGNKTSSDLNIGNPTDEQVSSAVETWLDEHPEATTTLEYTYNERGSFITVEDDGSVVTERVFDKYSNGYTKNLFTDYEIGTRLNGSSNASYVTSNYIKVIPGVPYCASRNTTTVYTYDKDKNVLGTSGLNLSTTGRIFNADVAYIRVEFFYQSAYTYSVQMGEVYTLKYPSSYIPEYAVNENFSKMLDSQVGKRVKKNAFREFGRYGGDIDLNKYTRMFNYTNTATSMELVEIEDDSVWFGYGVRQIARLTHVSTSTANLSFWFCKSSGTPQLMPSEHGFDIGDTMYIGFMGRANKVVSPANNISGNDKTTITFIKNYEPIVIDEIPHFYEYEILITEENLNANLSFSFSFGNVNDLVVEISNLYMSNKPNVNKCIFEDLKRKEVVEKIISRKFENKTWLALGDSITNQGNYIAALRNYMPFRTIDNQGIGGSTIIDKSMSSDGCTLIDTLGDNITNADVITIAYGTNDSNYLKTGSASTYGVSIGELNTEDSVFDKKTFYGAYQYVIEKILSTKPTVPIVLIVPAVSMIVDSSTMTNTEKRALRDSVAKAVKDVADFYALPYVDLYTKSGMNEFNRVTYAPDGVHPGTVFGDITARLMIPIFEHMKVD